MQTKIEAEGQILNFGARRIPYSLHHGENKRLRVVVSPEMKVDVYAPMDADAERLQEALRKKAPWIARVLDKIETYQPLPTPKLYLSGESLVYLGRQYRLKVETGSNQSAKLTGGFLWVWVEDGNDTRRIKKSVDAWYRKRAAESFGRYMKECQAIASRHGVPESVMALRTMHRRWGSCGPTGRITLNVNLVQVPVHCIEYVIMHEICHLKHHNHSKAFYSLLTRCQPDWRKRKETLDRFRIS